MKYSAGMAVQYLPFFLAAHAMAPVFGYPADGFSTPYQFSLQLGSLLFCFVGLWFLRKVLAAYFSDKTVAWVIVLFVIGSNYLNYAAIDTAMTHNYLFSWYAILLWLSHSFYTKPSYRTAAYIGLTLGIMGLTRPTELMGAIIPLAWGFNSFSISGIKERILLMWEHKAHYILAAVLCGVVGFIQIAYWKYVTGEWLVYSYQDQHLNWVKPHLFDYAFHFRSGWLLYTPLMIFAYLGIIPLVKKRIQLLPILSLMVISYYVTSAWDIWWYGGRAMIQYYPVMAFPFAAFVGWILESNGMKWLKYISILGIAISVYLNIWWVHHAHRGSLLDMGNMTEAYYKRVIGRWDAPEETKKLLDTDELFDGVRDQVSVLYSNDFENDTTALSDGPVINGARSVKIDGANQFTPKYSTAFTPGDANWIRVSTTFSIPQKEWNFWMMPQIVVAFSNQGTVIKQKMIRIHRFMHDGETKRQYLDVKVPKTAFDAIEVYYWNADGQKITYIDDLLIESFL